MNRSSAAASLTSKGLMDSVQEALPKIVLGPTLIAALVFVYGFILWTAWLSFTESRLLPRYEFAGLVQYVALFENARWWTALKNLAIFGIGPEQITDTVVSPHVNGFAHQHAVPVEIVVPTGSDTLVFMQLNGTG